MNKKTYVFWILIFAVAIYRLIHFGIDLAPNEFDCIGQKISGQGFVVDEPIQKSTGQSLTVFADKIWVASTSRACTYSTKIRIKTTLYPRFQFNDYISFDGKVTRPLNFGDRNVFDYIGYLAKDDIYLEMKSGTVRTSRSTHSTTSSLSHNELLGRDYLSDKYNRLISRIYLFKNNFENILKRNLGEPYAALASGLVVGEKASLGKDLLDDFRKVGLIHIIVLSGYNITIVGDSLRKVLIFLPRIWGISLGALGIVIFGTMVGGGATVVRTCIMACIAMLAQLIRRDYSVLRALVFAGLMMLILNPKILFYDPSFQLSFLATFGLIIFGNKFDKIFSFVTERFGLRSIFASTFATQVFVTPFLLFKMGQISIIGLVVNILVLPIIPLTMLFIFLTGTSGLIYAPLAKPLSFITYIFLKYEISIVRYFARIPFAIFRYDNLSIYFVYGYYLIIAIYFIYANIRPKPNIDKAI